MIYNLERPTNFDAMVGQEIVVENIRNQSIRNQFFPVFVLCGQFGSGKTTMARIIAMAANCKCKDESGNPCGKCESCKAVMEHSREGIIEIDGASNNGVDNVRALLSQASTIGVFDKKVIVIDEAHMLSKSAFNALLITLENPPSHCIFILCTTEKDALPETVISRAPVYVFGKISDELIKEHILCVAEKNDIPISDDAAGLLARYANGAMRNALQLLEHLSLQKLEAEEITEQNVVKILGLSSVEQRAAFLEACLYADTYSIITILKELEKNGQSLRSFIQDVLQMNTDLIYKKAGAAITGTKFYVEKIESLKSVSDAKIIRANQMLSKISATPANLLSLDRIVADVISVIHTVKDTVNICEKAIKAEPVKNKENDTGENAGKEVTEKQLSATEGPKTEAIDDVKPEENDGFMDVVPTDDIPFEVSENKEEIREVSMPESNNLFGTGFGLLGGGLFSNGFVMDDTPKEKKAKEKMAGQAELITQSFETDKEEKSNTMIEDSIDSSVSLASTEQFEEKELRDGSKVENISDFKDSIPPNEEESMTWEEAAKLNIVPNKGELKLPVPESDEELEEKYYSSAEELCLDDKNDAGKDIIQAATDEISAKEELAKLLKSAGFRVIYKKARMVDKGNQIYLYFENMGYVMAAKAMLSGCTGITAELDKK